MLKPVRVLSAQASKGASSSSPPTSWNREEQHCCCFDCLLPLRVRVTSYYTSLVVLPWIPAWSTLCCKPLHSTPVQREYLSDKYPPPSNGLGSFTVRIRADAESLDLPR